MDGSEVKKSSAIYRKNQDQICFPENAAKGKNFSVSVFGLEPFVIYTDTGKGKNSLQ